MLALTAIGYVHAVQGLREEAQATLRADAAVVGNAIDVADVLPGFELRVGELFAVLKAD